MIINISNKDKAYVLAMLYNYALNYLKRFSNSYNVKTYLTIEEAQRLLQKNTDQNLSCTFNNINGIDLNLVISFNYVDCTNYNALYGRNAGANVISLIPYYH